MADPNGWCFTCEQMTTLNEKGYCAHCGGIHTRSWTTDEKVRYWQARAQQLEQENARLMQALEAAEQFIVPGIDRGPAIDGWENTIALVSEALGKPVEW